MRLLLNVFLAALIFIGIWVVFYLSINPDIKTFHDFWCGPNNQEKGC
jgi:hypothetical protein